MTDPLIRRRLITGIAVVAVAVGGYFLLQGRDPSSKAGKKAGRPAPVFVDKVSQRAIPLRVAAIGTVQARATVTVRSRVDGQLLAAPFGQGEVVKKGDILFRIDPLPFEARLRQAQANLARDKAMLAKSLSDLRRYQDLSNKGFSSQQKYEEAKASVGALEATIHANEAAVQMARLDLGYTSIHAPIDGRAGAALVDPGNLVKANETPLVVLNEVRPIYVTFSVPEHNLVQIRARFAQGPLGVQAAIPGDTAPPAEGKLDFINNAVDPQTGTIMLRSTFANADDRLIPGQFVNVSVTLSTLHDATVVPARTVQTGQRGSYVFVVKPNKTVEQRPVAIGATVDDFTVVTDGLTVGETVVTEGQLRLFPGARIEPKQEADAKAPAGGEQGKPKTKKKDSDKAPAKNETKGTS